jgi:hypothetical protein
VPHSSFPTRRPLLVSSLLLVAATALAAPAMAKTTVKGAYAEGAKRGQTFTTIVVVGVSPNVNQRCAFEFFMASRLKSDSVKVYRSCDLVEEKTPLTVESIEYAVTRAQADAVLSTTLVARSLGEQKGSRDTRGTAGYKAVGAGLGYSYYGTYSVPVIYGEFSATPEFTVAESQGQVSSNLYRTQDKSLVYTLDTQVKKVESTDAGLQEVAAAIADKLRKEKLTK